MFASYPPLFFYLSKTHSIYFLGKEAIPQHFYIYSIIILIYNQTFLSIRIFIF